MNVPICGLAIEVRILRAYSRSTIASVYTQWVSTKKHQRACPGWSLGHHRGLGGSENGGERGLTLTFTLWVAQIPPVHYVAADECAVADEQAAHRNGSRSHRLA